MIPRPYLPTNEPPSIPPVNRCRDPVPSSPLVPLPSREVVTPTATATATAAADSAIFVFVVALGITDDCSPPNNALSTTLDDNYVNGNYGACLRNSLRKMTDAMVRLDLCNEWYQSKMAS